METFYITVAAGLVVALIAGLVTFAYQNGVQFRKVSYVFYLAHGLANVCMLVWFIAVSMVELALKDAPQIDSSIVDDAIAPYQLSIFWLLIIPTAVWLFLGLLDNWVSHIKEAEN